MGAGRRVARIETVAIARGTQIPADRLPLPHPQGPGDDGRHQPVWVQPQIFGVTVAAEGPAMVDPVVFDVQLGASPQHLLHVRRRRTAPNLQNLWHSALALGAIGASESWRAQPSVSVYSRPVRNDSTLGKAVIVRQA